MWLPWNVAAAGAVALAIFGVTARRSLRHRVAYASGFALETALVLILYAVWQLAGNLAVTRVAGGLANGRWVWQVERAWHLPSEVTVQRLVLAHPLVVQACNIFYAGVHVPTLIVFLIWMFVRHRDRYPAVRNILALCTASCFFLQLIPVAPPRMFPVYGFVDTALRYHQSVYGAMGAGTAPQLSAMPSVHVAWAVLVGVAAVTVSTSRWRWLALAHPVLTTAVVVATANHFWLDGIVAVALLGAAAGVQWSAAAMWRARPALARRAGLRPVTSPEPERPLPVPATR